MPPPDERSKGELSDAGEVFGIIQVLIRTVPQVLTLHQLMDCWIEAWRGVKRKAYTFLFQGVVRRFKLGSYFCRDRSFLSKEPGIGQQRGLFIGEQERIGHHDRDVEGG